MKVHDGLAELSFTSEQIEKMEALALKENQRDYFLLALMGRRGLRVSEVLQVTPEKIQQGGVLVKVKGGSIVLRMLAPPLYKALSEYAHGLPKFDQLIPVGRRQAYNLCLKYAKEAGVQNWQRAHPHRWRHYFGTYQARRTGRDPWKVKSLMGHKDLRATAPYVDNLSPEEELQELSG